MIQPIDPTQIDPNPFQPVSRLNFTPDALSDLASIADPAIGLRIIPTVRPHPDQPGRYQRCDGHRRMAAWQLFRPGEPMPNNVEELTDRQMYDYMAIENGQRQDLTPIEKAVIIKGHIERFGTSQVIAGALVGIKTQGAVSNLIKLLDLPADVQPLVNPQQVPQRIARLLVRPGQIAPQDTLKIAQAIAEAEDEDKEDVADNELRQLIGKIGKPIMARDFKIDWKPHQLYIDSVIESPPACLACEAMVKSNGPYCTRPACYEAKKKGYPVEELGRVATKFGIPIAAPGEKVTNLDIDYRQEAKVKAWLTAKQRPAHLRLIINPNPQWMGPHNTLLGSDHVRIASLDPHALNGPAPKKETPKADAVSETNAQRIKRIQQEQLAAEQRRAERSAARRARADVTWLMQQITLDTAAQLKIEGGVLDIAEKDIARSTGVFSDWPELLPFERTLHAPKEAATCKQHIVFKLLLVKIQSYQPAERYSWSRALKLAGEVVEKDLKVKLMPGWNTPPIHNTASNCWTCGAFTPGPALTNVDKLYGWRVVGDVVSCSEKCQRAYRPAAPPTKPAAKAPAKTAAKPRK